jgi:hypothetical protein
LSIFCVASSLPATVIYPVPTYSLYDTLVEIQAGVAVRAPEDLPCLMNWPGKTRG